MSFWRRIRHCGSCVSGETGVSEGLKLAHSTHIRHAHATRKHIECMTCMLFIVYQITDY